MGNCEYLIIAIGLLNFKTNCVSCGRK